MAEDTGAIRQAIERTRGDIAETMEALGHKADVKSRLSEGLKEQVHRLAAQGSVPATQAFDRLQALQNRLVAALDGPNNPVRTATVDSARKSSAGWTSDPARRRAIVITAGALMLLLLMRRNSHE